MKPQPWLAPLAPIYGGVVRAKNAAYDRGILSTHTLRSPVISIGNLSTGGGGKTPLVIALARLLTADGISVDVLSRGYGRKSDAVERVLPELSEAAYRFGDEPLLIARAADVPVFVGPSRFAAGMLAEQTAQETNHVHLLDDGFQHRQLARDLDIVVLHPSDLSEKLLPAGHLREPLSSLRRAHVIVIREEDNHVADAIGNLRPNAQIWRIRRTLHCEIPDAPPVAFAGIARPEEFFAGLRKLGIELAATVAYPDHHRYSEEDVRGLIEQCRNAKARHLITTGKDAVKLSPVLLATIAESVTLRVAALETSFLESATVLETLNQAIAHHVSNSEPDR